MNGAHFHLTVNHLPIIFPMVGLIVFIAGFIFKSETTKRVALFIFALGAIATMPAFASGEGAAHTIKGIEGIERNRIHQHEETAELFSIFSYILGVLSLVGLWASWKGKKFANYLFYAVFLLGFVVMFLAKNTGTTGGEIRHTEIRSDFVKPAMSGESDEEHED